MTERDARYSAILGTSVDPADEPDPEAVILELRGVRHMVAERRKQQKENENGQ